MPLLVAAPVVAAQQHTERRTDRDGSECSAVRRPYAPRRRPSQWATVRWRVCFARASVASISAPTLCSIATSMLEARAFWVTAPGRGEIRTQRLRPPASGELLVRSLAGAVSRGTEALVFRGEVPQSEGRRMRCPFQEGEFRRTRSSWCTARPQRRKFRRT